jgi:hypothetical protein
MWATPVSSTRLRRLSPDMGTVLTGARPRKWGPSLRSARVQPFSAVPARIAPNPTEMRAEPAVVGSG